MRIIPAIDLIDGKCVRLTEGDYAQKKIYADNPTEVAKQFEDWGAKYLHVVDLDGAKAGRIINARVLESICTHTRLHVDFGGGIKTDADIALAFDCGVAQITAGSIAVKQPEKVAEWITRFGSDKIILGADVRHEKIAISGWQDTTEIDLYQFLAQYITQGIHTIICTDITRDGKLAGAAIELYQKIQAKFPALNIVASGGVASIADIEQLHEVGIYGAIIGKALYENKITWEELSIYLAE